MFCSKNNVDEFEDIGNTTYEQVLHVYCKQRNHIVGVIGIVLDSIAVGRGFEPRSGQTKDYKIGICCFSAKHAELRRKNKDWLARDQDNVSEWGDMSIPRTVV